MVAQSSPRRGGRVARRAGGPLSPAAAVRLGGRRARQHGCHLCRAARLARRHRRPPGRCPRRPVARPGRRRRRAVRGGGLGGGAVLPRRVAGRVGGAPGRRLAHGQRGARRAHRPARARPVSGADRRPGASIARRAGRPHYVRGGVVRRRLHGTSAHGGAGVLRRQSVLRVAAPVPRLQQLQPLGRGGARSGRVRRIPAVGLHRGAGHLQCEGVWDARSGGSLGPGAAWCPPRSLRVLRRRGRGLRLLRVRHVEVVRDAVGPLRGVPALQHAHDGLVRIEVKLVLAEQGVQPRAPHHLAHRANEAGQVELNALLLQRLGD